MLYLMPSHRHSEFLSLASSVTAVAQGRGIGLSEGDHTVVAM